MSDPRTFTLALKCPRCWRHALFTDLPRSHFTPGVLAVASQWYDRHGAAPIPGPGQQALCPLCGGYLRFSSDLLQDVSAEERQALGC